MTSFDIPKKVGRYQVTRELGRGGMGAVFLAHDPLIDRQAAIKTTVISSSPGDRDPELYKRLFFNEARAAGRLIHPHIVSIYDAIWGDDMSYLIMEYVEGTTLKEYMNKEDTIPFEKVLKYFFQCAKALDYAHQNGVIHRDIKPSNIMVSNKDEVKISDFGIAYVEGTLDLTISESFTGSAHYISPERIRKQLLTQQTDIFSLGVVMYELISGIKPFDAENEMAIFYKIANEDPEPLRRYRIDIPESLEQIINRTLSKNLKERYKSSRQLASDLSTSFDILRFSGEVIDLEEKYNALKKIDFFKDFSAGELKDVINNTQWIKYDPGNDIISEGEIEDCFFIIIVGKVIVKKGAKTLAVLTQGDSFGEMAHLGTTKRTATIKSQADTVLMKINSSIIDQTSINTQLRFYKVFSNTLIRRLTRTSELLSKEKP